ncbi:uncharacterized protein LOC133888247 [Phragmites australis]|uniref:uncharacterized protein LOC133888247 n=1 Tax=Phragmites australis TaxID=29695 RepID=UPI002D767B10|nr:uncharacterized protein LOC133888247 [Phragmites australis]XP_062184397.1 uncharacterized protein LOC133888247 [Phragmites australis]
MQAPRSRLLLSCGESILAVAESAYRRVETMSCPVGCLARGFSHVAAPVLRPLRLRLRCLSALSFVDRQLVVAQDVAAVLLPRAERVLRKVDDLVLLVESLPVRFDGAVDGLEALVAGVRSGVAGFGFAPVKQCRVDEGGDVFRDIRCDEEAGGAADQDVEKICEDVAPEAGILGVVTVDDGSGARDGVRTIGVAYAEKITGETRCNEEMAHSGTGDDYFRPSSEETGRDDDDAAQGADREATHPEAAKQEVGSDESEGEGDPMKFEASGAEQRAEGVRVKQDGRSRSMEVVEAHAAEIMQAMQSRETEKAESQQAASPEAGTSETGETSGKESSNKDGNLLDLFDEAWQHKLA